MPRKKERKKEKIKNYLNFKRMNEVLYLAMCQRLSFEEMLDWWKKTGFEEPGWLWDKNDPKQNEAFYKEFGDRLMKHWHSGSGDPGKRPWLFYKVYPEKPKILNYLLIRDYNPEQFEKFPFPKEDGKKYSVYEAQEDFLRRVGLLEDWEIKEIEKQKREGTYEKFKDKLIYKNIEYERSNYFD